MAEESKIEKAVSDYAKKKGCYVRKFKSTSQRGVPDRLFLAPNGVVFFVEFKAPGKQPTALQLREMKLIQSNMGRAVVVDSIKSGKAVVDLYTS